MSTVYVFGHRNPDNDAIMSAVIASQLLNELADGNTYVPVRLGPVPAETSKVLAECNIPEPELLESIPEPAEGEGPVRVFLTDHNEETQSIDGLYYYGEIVGCVDHHRIGDFHTTSPVFMVALPWGSTCSILYQLFKDYGIEPTEAQLKCILSAMMTDMVMLKSPTTTDVDRRFTEEIAGKLGIDPIEFGMSLFQARPAQTPDEMVSTDIKLFDVAGQKLLIGQYETVAKDSALEQLEGIRAAMEAYMAEQGADGIVLCITDIMEEGSQVLMAGDVAVAERGLGIPNEEAGVWMAGVMSRKKQVAAPILAAAEA